MPQPNRPRPQQPQLRRIWWLSWVDRDGREVSPRYRAHFRRRGSNAPLRMPEVEGAVGVKVWRERKGGKELMPDELFEDVRAP